MDTSEKPVAIVSGASRGIGKAVALKLLKEGFAVVGLYKSNDEAASLLAQQGADMQKVDVGIEADIVKAIGYIKQTYGRIDIVVNNAGIDIFGNIESYSMRDWNTMLATDLTSVFLLSKYSIPLLKKADGPSITNISSRLGIDAFVEPDFIVYGAVKAAVNIFTLGLAKELKDSGIRVNAVIPTPTKTDLFDEVFTPGDEEILKAKGKLGTPEEAAELVLRLINDTSLNGQLLFDERVVR
jgi:3-oxoacyl-[acyl-carrier protein] reductase